MIKWASFFTILLAYTNTRQDKKKFHKKPRDVRDINICFETKSDRKKNFRGNRYKSETSLERKSLQKWDKSWEKNRRLYSLFKEICLESLFFRLIKTCQTWNLCVVLSRVSLQEIPGEDLFAILRRGSISVADIFYTHRPLLKTLYDTRDTGDDSSWWWSPHILHVHCVSRRFFPQKVSYKPSASSSPSSLSHQFRRCFWTRIAFSLQSSWHGRWEED